MTLPVGVVGLRTRCDGGAVLLCRVRRQVQQLGQNGYYI